MKVFGCPDAPHHVEQPDPVGVVNPPSGHDGWIDRDLPLVSGEAGPILDDESLGVETHHTPREIRVGDACRPHRMTQLQSDSGA